ncbi:MULTISPECIES: hypothetical protein [Ochrobactrum]|uniref:Uncharacterized protein n=1 Tax=Ochrobactrum chromiisoli TaxID=2993941 RepID=A0ABT3QRI3_9HYPH|nr:hypothetical protein [Ochrobactrum chromiisoli]MCX2698232.1 hypothetical protein [Ochrobactrum chromiisoli]
MNFILIEKYVDGICVEQFKLPAAPLKFLSRLLPNRALRELQHRGLDIIALLNDTDQNAAVQWMEVGEGKTVKRIRISRVTSSHTMGDGSIIRPERGEDVGQALGHIEKLKAPSD